MLKLVDSADNKSREMVENNNGENVPPRQMLAKEAEANMKELLIDLVKAGQFL